MVSKITYELLKNSDVFKNIPILTLDERWYHLINEKNKTDEIAYWEKQVNELLKKQGRINNDIKDIKKLKKQLINDVVENMEDDDSSRQKQKRMSQNQRLIQESNDKIASLEDELLEVPRELARANEKEDVQARYAEFQRVLFASLEDYTDPIPGVVETISALRAQGIRIGSTTGYTRSMMDVVLPAATAKGYAVDNCVTPDGLPAGRPAPYMIYKNMADLAIPSVDCVLKYGDTIADIKEGINAKAWTVGVVLGSNELGLTQEEVSSLPADELEARKADVRRRMLAAGAHYVVDTIAELPAVIAEINRKLEIL